MNFKFRFPWCPSEKKIKKNIGHCVGDKKTVHLGVVSEVNMNTFGVYWLLSKTHMLVLSVGFCIKESLIGQFIIPVHSC